MTIIDKEKNIVGAILHCNNEIRKYLGNSNAKLFESLDIYKYNMLNLYSTIIGENRFDITDDIPNPIQNNRNNFYAYFKKVDEFLNGYEISTQQTLNESLIVDLHKVKNPVQLDINTFKLKLKELITNIEKQNDFEKLTPEILKIKVFSKKPIYVNGYNITMNSSLIEEIKTKFNVSQIYSVCYIESLKQILFITNESTTCFVYDLKLDLLDYYNQVNEPIQYFKFNSVNYFDKFKELSGYNSIYELQTTQISNDFIKSVEPDNLYSDTKLKIQYENWLQNKQKNNILR